MIQAVHHLNLSGERFDVVYHVTGDQESVKDIARDICIEQTIEFPADLIDADDDIRHGIMGQVRHTSQLHEDTWEVIISYAIETTGFTLPQFLNVVFGNISIKPNIRVAKLMNLPATLLNHFKGPRFGVAGLRSVVNEPPRALLCTALKPMGLSSQALAQQAYEFAKGGIDFIKDDHGLANQSFAPYRERVIRCAEAVAKANQETGYQCRYVPCLSSPMESIMEDALFAKSQEVGGLLIAPGLVGFDTMRAIADHDDIALPILAHPSFVGSYVLSPQQGISHDVLFGQLMRLSGADTSIFPNYGGRFSFSREECRAIAEGTQSDMMHIKKSFPSPGGGMTLDRIKEIHDFYGSDMMFLIGGALHRGEKGLTETCSHFREFVEKL